MSAATGIEIANAYIALYTKMPGVASDIKKSLGGADVQSTITGSGKSMGAALAGAVGGAVAAVTSKAIGTVMTSLDGAIKRVDVMGNFPKIMKNLGFSADDASKSITTMSDKLTGLPTSLDQMAGAVQQLAPLTGGLDEATGLSLALNNALLAGGKATDLQSNAMDQYVQMLAVGKVDMAAWRSMVSAMPGQMDQLSKSLLGGTAKQTDLYEAMKAGEVTFDQFNAALLDLNENGLDKYASFADQARDATDGIGTAQANLGTAITRGLANLIADYQPQITAAFATATDVVNGTFKAVRGLSDLLIKGEFTDTLRDAFGWEEDAPIVDMLLNARDATISFGEGLIDAAGWVVQNKDWLLPLTIGIGAGTVAFKLWNTTVAITKSIQAGYVAASYGAVAATYAATIAENIGTAAYALKNSTLVKTIAAMRVNEALTLRTKISIIAATAATSAWTVAQKAFSAVASANPIGLLVAAVVALVGALVWFFTQTETGKKIWAEFTQFLGEAWANIQGFFVTAWENYIQPVFQAIGEIAVWLYETVLKPVFDKIAAVVEFVAGVIKLAFDLIVNYYRFWGAVSMWLWDKAIKPAFDAIGKGITWLWEKAIKPAIDAIRLAFDLWWALTVKPVVNWISAGLEALGAVFNWLNENVVQPAWSAMKTVMRLAWEWIDQKVFTPFKAGIDLIAKGFEIAKSAIEKTWEGIKKAAAVPINFVLGTVWNNGLRSFWNDIVGELGLDDMKLAKAPLIKFASGGVLPGWSPGRDIHQFWSPTGGRLALSGGEAIMRPEFTRAVGGPAGVAAINAAARRGEAFADGGVWGAVKGIAGDIWDNVKGAVKLLGSFLGDPIGTIQTHLIDGILKPLIGDGNVFLRGIGQLPINLAKNLGKKFSESMPAVGAAGMGWEAMWKIVQAAVPGTVMTSGFRDPGLNAAVGGVNGSYHTMGRAIDLVPATMATFEAVRKLFPNASELIYTPAGGRQLLNGQPFAGWLPSVAAQHWDHVHLAMASGGVIPKLYDQGGWLPHGGVAVNASGRPEAVLDPAESAALKRGLGGGDVHMHVKVVAERGVPISTQLTNAARRLRSGRGTFRSEMEEVPTW